VNASTPVQELWNYCNVLRDDGVGYVDYVDPLTSSAARSCAVTC
jgi:type I restriction enzyme M protein